MSLRIVEIQKDSWIMDGVPEPYCEIFREEPWKEELEPKEVIETMREQLERPGAIALAAIKDKKVVGFIWMYEIFKSDLKEGTRYSPKLKFLFENQKRVLYLQEMGVIKEMRQQGIGEKLARELLRRGKQNGAKVVVLSTNGKAKSMISLISKIGFQNSGIVRPPKELGRTYWVFELMD